MALEKMVAAIMAEADLKGGKTAMMSFEMGGHDLRSNRSAVWRLDVLATRVRDVTPEELAENHKKGYAMPEVRIDGVLLDKLPDLPVTEVVTDAETLASAMEKIRAGKDGSADSMINAIARLLESKGLTVADLVAACDCPKCRSFIKSEGDRRKLHLVKPDGLTH